MDKGKKDDSGNSIATFGSGCFWCSEAAFSQLPGVLSVKPGYMGGSVATPTYQDVCSGRTGHAEVVQITYASGTVTYEQLLTLFFKIHNPTQLNRQGEDVGTQYRSIIFYHSDEQLKTARQAIDEEAAHWDAPVVTALEPATGFYPAEDYHQDYYFRNRDKNPYCQLVIKPKLGKLGLQN